MGNLTLAFKQCIDILEQERPAIVARPVTYNYVLKDTFLKEAQELRAHIAELANVIESVKQDYLSSSADTDGFDTEMRLQLKACVDKFKFLEKYEKQRQQKTSGFFTSKEATLYATTVKRFREGVLLSLNQFLRDASSQLSVMQESRLSRQRELDTIGFNQVTITKSQPLESTRDEVEHYERTVAALSQEQIQVLETEHEDLLQHKNEELAKIEKLARTVTEIAQLQGELAHHLSSQTENINSLLDVHDDIQVDITEGNKQLKRAKGGTAFTTKVIVYSCIFVGIAIILLDWVN